VTIWEILLKPEVFGPLATAIGGGVAWLATTVFRRSDTATDDRRVWEQETYERYQTLAKDWKTAIKERVADREQIASLQAEILFKDQEIKRLKAEIALVGFDV